MDPASLQSCSEVSQSQDFTRCLPLQLSMYILGFLDKNSLKACCDVNRHWAFLAGEVKREHECRMTMQKDFLQLKELCPRKTISNYAKRVSVPTPQLNEEGDVIEEKSTNQKQKSKQTEEVSLQAAYSNLKTDNIQLEERNVFCGSYNIRVLMGRSDKRRMIHYNGGNLVAVASANRRARLLGVPGVKEVPPLLYGHAGSITALHLSEEKGLLLTASFDLSIRCWNIHSGACVNIFNGHYGTITCLDLHQNQFVSGAGDGMVKVWSLTSGECLNTLMHNSVVCVVKLDGAHVVSGCEQGLVKVWCADTGALIKTLEKHQGPVTCLSFDQWHLVTGSSDRFVLGWSMLGNVRRRLIAFFHPKWCQAPHHHNQHFSVNTCKTLKCKATTTWSQSEIAKCIAHYFKDPNCVPQCITLPGQEQALSVLEVAPFHVEPDQLEVLSLEFLYLRVVSGCADGKIRVFNFLTGTCLKVLVVNSSGDPVSSLYVAENRMVINSPTRLVMFQFKDVTWDYSLAADREIKVKEKEKQPKGKSRRSPTQQKTRSQSPQSRGRSKTPSREVKKPASCQQPDGKPEHGPSLPAPAHPDEAEAPLKHEQSKGPSHPMSLSRLLLTINTLQNTSKPALVSSSTKHSAKARESQEWSQEHQQHCPEKVPTSKTLLQHQKDQTDQLQRARLHSDSLTMKKISTPFETKMVQLKLQNSLHRPTVKSSIPAPCVVRPKACGFLGEKKVSSGHGKAIALPRDGVQFTDLYTASSELVKPAYGTAAQTKSEVCRRREPFCSSSADPAWRDSGFRLLTAKQVYEAAARAWCQEGHTEPREDQERARKKAWLRKVKGLPVDSFTGERKTPAPELGYNVFI